ncbi:MAG: DUF2141 domain-containing protein [Bacteroidetes bacterium]|nr:MAG: DUF2141 domain-containing protein [Bacteroidota bacterium]
MYLLLATLLLTTMPPPADTGTLIIEVQGIEEAGGFIWVGLYDSEAHYMVKEKAIVKGYDVTHTGTMRLEVHELPAGRWAIALFHDIDGDGELDTNYLGIPSEPYAFSRKPPSKWRAPRYDEVAIPFRPPLQRLSVRLERWSL